MPDIELNSLRDEIDAIDRRLVPLFVARMQAAERIAEHKRSAGVEISDALREQEVIARAVALVPDELREETRKFMVELIALSREYQQRLISGIA